MISAFQIAIGIWLGVLFLIGTFMLYNSINKIKYNIKYGNKWYYKILEEM